MDAHVYLVLVPALDLQVRGLSKRNQTWQGLESEESKRRFDWGAHLTVERARFPIRKRFAEWLELSRAGEDWDCLSITGDGLDMYWSEIRGSAQDWDGRDFESSVRILVADVSKWVLVFDIDDSIDDHFTADVESLVVRMREHLLAEPLPRGFVAYGGSDLAAATAAGASRSG